MTIKKEFLNTADVQSFAVSSTNIYVPFIWNTPSAIFNRNNRKIEYMQIDYAGGTLLCLPKTIFDILYGKGILDFTPNMELISQATDERSIAELETAIYRNNLLLEHLASVQIQDLRDMIDKTSLSTIVDAFRQVKWFVKVDSIRVTPYIGTLVPASRKTALEQITVPKEYGISIQSDGVSAAISPNATTSNEIEDLRGALLEDINNAINSDKQIDAEAKGPYIPDINKTVSYHCNNQIILDQDKKQLAIYTNIENEPRITYNGVSDTYSSKANTRIYGSPVAMYETNEADNPAQGYQHSTFMTPTPGLISSPLGSLTSRNQELPGLFQAFASLLG